MHIKGSTPGHSFIRFLPVFYRLTHSSTMASESNAVVFVDIEASGGNRQEIVQIGARCRSEQYSVYVSITDGIHYAATEKHGISKVNGRLMKNNVPLPTVDLYSALTGFIEFLNRCGGQNKVYLAAYHGKSVDFPSLYRDVVSQGLRNKFQHAVDGSTDVLDVFQDKGVYRAGTPTPALRTLATTYGVQVTRSHDAVYDAEVLQKLCSRLGVQVSEIQRHADHYF